MWSPLVSVYPPVQLPGAKDFLKSQSERSDKRSYGEETGVCIVCGGTPPPNMSSGAVAGVVGGVGSTVVGRPHTQETETSFLRVSSSPSKTTADALLIVEPQWNVSTVSLPPRQGKPSKHEEINDAETGSIEW